MSQRKNMFLGLAAVVVAAAGIAGCQTDGAAEPGTTAVGTLEPYTCGTVQRLHTYKGIFLASQPSAEDFEHAKKGGVKTVVNLRHASEQKGFDEKARVASLGMTYHNPAWNGSDELTDERFGRVQELLSQGDRPILLHCSSSNRVGAHWIVYRMLGEGADKAIAVAEARKVGLTSDAYAEKALAYVKRMRAGE